MSTFGKPKVCWTKVVQECNNSVALVINTVKGAAVGSNFQVRAAAAPAYFGTGVLKRTRHASAIRHSQPKQPRCELTSAPKTHQAIIESIR